MDKRIETDSLGEIEVPSSVYYGAQTARSLAYFEIGEAKMPEIVIWALAMIKQVCAQVNCEMGLLSEERSRLIIEAAKEVAAGKLKNQFPLRVWQTGSGTQTNMNVNEVISNRAIEIAGGAMGSKEPIHPNDHVNLSQSSNDVFPTAMSIAAAITLTRQLLPRIRDLKAAFSNKEVAFRDVVKIGRTHLMDALPLTLGQEFSAYVEQLDQNIERIEGALPRIYELAIGGTAVGTGLNAPKNFGEKVAHLLAQEIQLPFVSASNTFAAIATHDPLVFAHGALRTLACSLLKMATDLSWMGSGPRAGLSELYFPENEPGSSIMPGKINPTQCEALSMVVVHVLGNDQAITIAGSRGNFELNVYKPLIIYNFLDSVTMLSDALRCFTEHFIKGLQPNKERIRLYVERSLMLVTAMTPKLGYDRAAKIARKAFKENLSLKEATIQLGFLTEKEFDDLVVPEKMT